ncbi:hypothetical protein BDV38DRAFT_17562 [Aspergillus pseudotamarii]|uniref:SET domain-containing protein n=1 Tax=Aspergillus pseudotamarii TaxID=132259 RepID=A0A5N6SBX3_ASPPS|nr:uncharacterized protein BDV38DRAFT_17562 [Aspergillus pseudotamarii]KAE8131457.1 hypothetical protein BDV38DRAFT_17562 [Aspergillus pseudotamarii]
MTDTSPVVITHPATEPYPVTVPLNSPAVNGAVSDSAAPEEEEPYTIKCICAFEDDDGNTVFCEGCETWQHIECYYHGRDVPDVHNCVDCEPRPLDGRRATERQRRLREQSDGGDRKAKRSGTKSQKKKTKDGEQVNGIHNRSESNARDQPPAKKAKTNHRASGSVSSLAGVPSFPPDSRKRTTTSMSPTKSSGPSIPLYSNEFLHLYDHDNHHVNTDSNLFVNLELATHLATWVNEPGALARASNGRSAQDVFTWSGGALDRSRWPSLATETIRDTNVDIDGIHPTWKILKTRDSVGKDEIVGEITGKIGPLWKYCVEASNRWQELRHPEPFVFFHPQLPLYIDSRHEGNILRYARRSCRPNVTIRTFITNEVEYHFCFVAKEDIAADSEITAMWYLDPQLFESTNGVVKQEFSDNAQDVAAMCISNVLSHFGGCACVAPPNCLLANVDRRRHPKALDTNSKQMSLKRKKTKSKPNISPPASNSRAGSEATKNLEEDDQTDTRSTSGSARGQTRSRDLTPTLQTPTEGLVFGESELSARDKRKIAAAEKKFQQLEQDQQASHRRKKRASGQSTQTTPVIGSSSAQAGYFTHLSGRDRQSHSPTSAISPGSLTGGRHGSPRKASNHAIPSLRTRLGRPQYVDSATQTEFDVSDSLSPSNTPSRRPSFVPFTQRLLKRCYADRIRLEQNNQQLPVSPSLQSKHATHLMSPVSSPRAGPPTVTTPSVSGDRDDMEMKDAVSPMGISPGWQQETSPLSGRSSIKPPLPPPWPSTAAHNSRIPGGKVNNHRIDLRVPLPATIPLLPPANSPGSGAPAVISSPSTSDTAIPGSSVTAPSPVKKKLSLGDYLIRRGTLTTPTSEKPQTQATPMPPPKSPTAQPHMSREVSTVSKNELAQARAVGEGGSAKSSDVPMKDVSGLTQASQLSSLS